MFWFSSWWIVLTVAVAVLLFTMFTVYRWCWWRQTSVEYRVNMGVVIFVDVALVCYQWCWVWLVLTLIYYRVMPQNPEHSASFCERNQKGNNKLMCSATFTLTLTHLFTRGLDSEGNYLGWLLRRHHWRHSIKVWLKPAYAWVIELSS